jgi:Zn-dependent protease with chaperone function
MIDIDMYRYEREPIYFLMCAILGGMLWALVILAGVVSVAGLHILTFLLFPHWLVTAFWSLILVILLSWWIGREYFKAQIFGNCIRVSETQYPEIYKTVTDLAKEMGMVDIPYVFIVPEKGQINAYALRFIGHAYVVMYAALVDLMLKRNATRELRMILGHELAHHAAGHVSILKNYLIFPVLWVPFLGFLMHRAYFRACELTADRIGMILTGDLEAASRALTSLAGGCESLSSQTNINSFLHQEREFITFFGFLNDVVSTHPRLTRRANMLDAFGKTVGIPARAAEALGQWQLYGVAGPLAGKAVALEQGGLIIGRDARMCNLVISGDSGQISKKHCQLRFDSVTRGFYLEDCGSTNGTFLASGQKLSPGVPHPLRPGDRFYLANPEVAFELRAR